MAEVCVIYNPVAGRGAAARRLARVRRGLGYRAAFWPTQCAGHAVELARQAAADFPCVAAAGGDGTVHEVANGLLRSDGAAVLGVLPVGSANDYAHALGLSDDWWSRSDPAIGVRAVDVGIVRGGDRERFFVNCLGVGFNGHVTREARRIKGLQGIPLYGLALIRTMRKVYEAAPLAIRLDDGEEQCVPTLSMTLGLGRREGNFPLTPQARLDDGLFDYLHVGRLSRLRLLCYFPRMISGRIPTDDPVLGVGQCRKVQIRSEKGLMLHTDGEFFCVPEEGVREVKIELLPLRLRVLGRLIS